MELFPIRIRQAIAAEPALPFTVYSVGSEIQLPLTRLRGYSANQLFFTFEGEGKFRLLGQKNWETLIPGTLLYIPQHMPHEYAPSSATEDWRVGYVSFTEMAEGTLSSWGFAQDFFRRQLKEIEKYTEKIRKIWFNNTPDGDSWILAELLFSLLMQLQRDVHHENQESHIAVSRRKTQSHEAVIDHAVRYIHDHLGLDIRVTDIAAHVGYSTKQLNRIFHQAFQKTPLQYMQLARLKMAHLLLIDHPEMSINYVADCVGMQPDYFAKLYRRVYMCTPSDSRIPFLVQSKTQ